MTDDGRSSFEPAETLARTRAVESSAGNTFSSGDPPDIVTGAGAWLVDRAGRRYLDLVCGSATTNLGHAHPAITKAITDAMAAGVLHTGTRLPHTERARLYHLLRTVLPEALGTVQLANSGSEATEIALKAARYATGRQGVIAFMGGYHGRTRGALSVTADRRIREPFLPLDPGVTFMPYPYTLRPPLPVPADRLVEACLDYIDRALSNPVSGIDRPAAILVEAVQGVSGVVVPPNGFLAGLREIANRHGAVLILDEIWNGFGRTGHLFGFERDGVTPDLVTFGKGMSAALPLSAVAGRAGLLDTWPAGLHTSTFQGNPLACAAAVATLNTLQAEGLVARADGPIRATFERLDLALRDAAGVAEMRVAGAMAGIEFADADGAPDAARAAALVGDARERGLLLYRGGWHGNVVMLVPPLTIESTDLEQACDVIGAMVRGPNPPL